MKNIKGYFIFTFLLFSACTTSRESLDSGLFSDVPCKAPCWNNLIPGKSARGEVYFFIDSLDSNIWKGRQTIGITTSCLNEIISDKPGNPVNSIVWFYIEDGILTYIKSINPNMPELREIVDHFGPPEYYKAIHVIGIDAEGYLLDIYYPRQGLAFDVDATIQDIGFIKPEMKASDIQYFKEGDMYSYFANMTSCESGEEWISVSVDYEMKYIQPWQGFGAINVIIVK